MQIVTLPSGVQPKAGLKQDKKPMRHVLPRVEQFADQG